jgi:hypothetical protein
MALTALLSARIRLLTVSNLCMMTEPIFTGPARSGTIGGFITVLLVNLPAADLIKTAVMAATGAAVSFFVSLLLNRWLNRRRK